MSTRIPVQGDELAQRRAARAAHPAGGRTAHPHRQGTAKPDVVGCPQCGCTRWRTEYVRLAWDPATAQDVRVTSCDDLLWCVDCGHELLLPELSDAP